MNRALWMPYLAGGVTGGLSGLAYGYLMKCTEGTCSLAVRNPAAAIGVGIALGLTIVALSRK